MREERVSKNTNTFQMRSRFLMPLIPDKFQGPAPLPLPAAVQNVRKEMNQLSLDTALLHWPEANVCLELRR
jgi:hypothetical protein